MFKDPTEYQRKLIEKLLDRDFPGAEILRQQLDGFKVNNHADDANGSFAIQSNRQAPAANLEFVIPVEGLVEANSPIEYLLHTDSGYLSELEVVTYDEDHVKFPVPIEDIKIMTHDERVKYERNGSTVTATKSKHQLYSLNVQQVAAWSLLVIGLLYFAGTTINGDEILSVPPSPLDIISPVILFAILPLLWLKKINDSQNQKRYLSSKAIITALTVVALMATSWGFYRDAQKYFVHQDELASQKFAAVNVVYVKRFNLVPNVAKSASALASQEQSIVSDITEARTAYLRSQSLDSKVGAINNFNEALTNISINVENYPDLKSDKGFLKLMDVIEKTEGQLMTAKNDYNRQITALNTESRTFPYNFLAGSFIDDPVKVRIDESVSSQILDSKQLLDNLN